MGQSQIIDLFYLFIYLLLYLFILGVLGVGGGLGHTQQCLEATPGCVWSPKSTRSNQSYRLLGIELRSIACKTSALPVYYFSDWITDLKWWSTLALRWLWKTDCRTLFPMLLSVSSHEKYWWTGMHNVDIVLHTIEFLDNLFNQKALFISGQIKSLLNTIRLFFLMWWIVQGETELKIILHRFPWAQLVVAQKLRRKKKKIFQIDDSGTFNILVSLWITVLLQIQKW